MGDFDKQRTRRPWLIAFSIMVLFCAVYSGLWLVLALSSRDQLVNWIEEQKDQGFNVRYDRLQATGYPFAICIEITNPGLGVPNNPASWDWQGTSLRVMAQLWDRNSFRLETSGLQVLAFNKAGQIKKFSGDIDYALGQLVLSEDKIKKVGITLRGVQLTNRDNPNTAISIPSAQLSLDRLQGAKVDNQSASWSLSGSTIGFSLPLFKASPLGLKLLLSFKARLLGNIKAGPLVQSLEDWRDRGGIIELEKLKMQHGPLKINTNGTLALDDKLQPIGALTANIEGFFETIDALKRLEVINARIAITAKMMLGVLSRTPAGGGPAILNLALTAQERHLYLGPVRLLKLPEINWLQLLSLRLWASRQ